MKVIICCLVSVVAFGSAAKCKTLEGNSHDRIRVAQKVVPDAQRFSETECRWLHRQFLDECMNSLKCTKRPEDRELSMSADREMHALGPVISVRAMDLINQICEQVCLKKKKINRQEWHKSVCKPLMK